MQSITIHYKNHYKNHYRLKTAKNHSILGRCNGSTPVELPRVRKFHKFFGRKK